MFFTPDGKRECGTLNLSGAVRFSSLGFRDFRLFWTGQLISLSGTWMQSVAQAWLVYRLSQSPLQLGMVAAANSLPILLFTLWGGVLADRFRKRNILIMTQVLSIIPALLLGILTSLQVVTVWHVAMLAFFLGTVNAIDIPTRQSFLAEMVGKGHVVNAIALNSAAFNGARIIGPVIAGVIIASLGISACFYLNALSYCAVIIGLARMQTRGEARLASGGMFAQFREGIQFIIHDRTIVSVISMIAVFSLIGLPFITLLPVFADEVLHEGAKGLGYLMASSGVGALVAALWIAVRGDIANKTKFFSVAACCFSMAVSLFALSRSFPLSLILIMIVGWGMVSYLASANSYIQTTVPDDLRGRVMSVYAFVFLGTTPLGNSLMGFVAERIGTTNAVALSGGLCFIISLVFARKYGKRTASHIITS